MFLGQLRPEMFSGIGALPKPAIESHVVNFYDRGIPVAPCRLQAQSVTVLAFTIPVIVFSLFYVIDTGSTGFRARPDHYRPLPRGLL